MLKLRHSGKIFPECLDFLEAMEYNNQACIKRCRFFLCAFLNS